VIAVGFRCPVCGSETSEWLWYRIHEGTVVLGLRCLSCLYEWVEPS